MKYQLTINFEDLEQLKSFVNDQEHIETIKLKKIFIKKTDDKRVSQTSSLHAKAKEYQLLNSEIGYKDCLKIVGKEIRDNKKEILISN